MGRIFDGNIIPLLCGCAYDIVKNKNENELKAYVENLTANSFKAIENSEFKDRKAKFVVYISKMNLFESNFFEKCLNISQFFALNTPSFLIDEDCSFTPREWKKVKELNDKFKEKNLQFGFEDYGKAWDVEQVERANNNIKKTVEEIKSKHLSPAEKLLYAYLTVTSRNYTDEKETEHSADSRSVYGILNSDKIVCVGYSAWLREIITALGDSNIQIFENKVHGHQNLLIHIKDSKYNLNGYYVVDPCWDSVNINESNINLNHFLIPIKDLTAQNKVYENVEGNVKRNFYYNAIPRKHNYVTVSANGVLGNEELWDIAEKEDKNIRRKRRTENNLSFNDTDIIFSTHEADVFVYLKEELGFLFISENICEVMNLEDAKLIFKAIGSICSELKNQEWSEYYPKLESIIKDNDIFAALISKYENIDANELLKEKISTLSDELQEKYRNTSLDDLTEQDLTVLGLYKSSSILDFAEKKLNRDKKRFRASIERDKKLERVEKIEENTTKKTPKYYNSVFGFKWESHIAIGEESVVLLNHLLKHSEAVEINTISNILTNVLKARHPEKTKEEIDLIVDTIIKHNIKRAKDTFVEGAENSFSSASI